MPALAILPVLKFAAALGALSGCGYYILCLYAARWFVMKHRSARPEGDAPPLSILKPLCGADPHAYESLRSHCVQDYPDFEVIFGVSDPNDPAIPIVERLIREFPERRIQLIVCSAFLGSNYKISNLIQMYPHAAHDYVLVNDSDISVQPDYLRRVMREFQAPRTGMATCVYRGIAGNSLGARLEALGISTDFIPGVLSARAVEGGIRFGLGATLAFRRTALDSIGGFDSVADYLGDDYELGKRISDAGYAVALADAVVEHHLPEYSFKDYLQHQLRWLRTTRDSRPRGYAGLVLTFGLPWAMLAVLLAAGRAWAWSLLGLTLLLRLAVSFTVGLGVLNDRGVLKQIWLLPLRDLISVGVWMAGFWGRRVVWRGNEFTLENGKLRP